MKNREENEDETDSDPGPEHPMLAKQSVKNANEENGKEHHNPKAEKQKKQRYEDKKANDNRGQSIPCSEWRPRRKKSKNKTQVENQNARKRKKNKVKNKSNPEQARAIRRSHLDPKIEGMK